MRKDIEIWKREEKRKEDEHISSHSLASTPQYAKPGTAQPWEEAQRATRDVLKSVPSLDIRIQDTTS
jgi:hypothetical protein